MELKQKKYSINELKELRARELYGLARLLNIKRYTSYKKDELIELILKAYESSEANTKSQGTTKKEKTKKKVEIKNKTEEQQVFTEKPIITEELEKRIDLEKPAETVTESIKIESEKFEKEDILSKLSTAEGRGILDIHPDGYGFLRSHKYLPASSDIYVAPSQIKRFGLREGDEIEGIVRLPSQNNEKYSALLKIEKVNGLTLEEIKARPKFENLIPIFPLSRFKLESELVSNLTIRLIDLITPLGKGQRGLIVSPPKAGKTTIIKRLAQSISINHPEVILMILLIDERPEEVTDMQRSVRAEVISSTFDQLPENHIRVVELAVERAKRLVELKRDVVILLDGITRLTRAYNLSVTPTGRTLTGGLDTASIHGPKKVLGAARNIDAGGSLTIIATSLVETGSKMDEIIYEEFKGTGNMELVLDRKLAERRLYPAIEIKRSGTRREELLYTSDELKRIWTLRRFLSNLDAAEALERLIKWASESPSNQKFLESIAVDNVKV